MNTFYVPLLPKRRYNPEDTTVGFRMYGEDELVLTLSGTYEAEHERVTYQGIEMWCVIKEDDAYLFPDSAVVAEEFEAVAALDKYRERDVA